MPSPPRPTPELRQWSNPVWYAATGEPGAQACHRTSANLLAARNGLVESSSCPESSVSSYSPRDMQPDYAFAVGVEGVPYVSFANAGGETEVEHCVELTGKRGAAVSPDRFICSHTPTREVARTYGFRGSACADGVKMSRGTNDCGEVVGDVLEAVEYGI